MWKPLASVILVFIRIKTPLYLTPVYEQLDMQHEGSIIIAIWLFRRWARHFNNHEWVERQRQQDKKKWFLWHKIPNIRVRKVVLFFWLVMCPPAACDAAWNAEDIRVKTADILCYVMYSEEIWGQGSFCVRYCRFASDFIILRQPLPKRH